MMTRDQINVFLAACLTTLAEMDCPAPESSFYIALEMNLADWQLIRQILLSANLATISANAVSITAKGREMAAKIEASIKGK